MLITFNHCGFENSKFCLAQYSINNIYVIFKKYKLIKLKSNNNFIDISNTCIFNTSFYGQISLNCKNSELKF